MKTISFQILVINTFALFLGLGISNHSFAGWYTGSPGTWQYRKAITITNASGSQSNFPVLVNITDNDLKNHSTGNPASLGYDILFTDNTGTFKIPYEREQYTSSTGALVAWVNVPSVTNGIVIYMYYGNSGAGDQAQATSVWTNLYSGVYHLDEPGAGTSLEYKDASTHLNHGTILDKFLQTTFNMTGTAGNNYDYQYIATPGNYTIVSGDVLVYDVLWTSSTDFVAVDLYFSDGSVLRTLNPADQNGIGAHPASDLSAFALNKLYHRQISLTGEAGKTFINPVIACEYDLTATKTAYLDNIYIINGANTKLTIHVPGGSTAHSAVPGTDTPVTNTETFSTPDASSANRSISGMIGNCLNADGSRYINMAGQAMSNTTSWTLSGWVNCASLPWFGFFVYNGNDCPASGYGIGVGNNSSPGTAGTNLGGLYGCVAYEGSTLTYSATTWTYVVMKRNASSNLTFINKNGTSSTVTGTFTPGAPTNSLTIGCQFAAGNVPQRYFYGQIDEVHLATADRSDNWITTEYNNQSNPSGFYSLGPELNCTSTSAIWVGTTNTDWNTGSNWCLGTVPNSSTVDVTIPADLVNQPIISSATSFSCHSITIYGTLIINGTGSLSVYGDWTNNGTLTANSTSTVTFIGTGAQAIQGTASTTFKNLTISGGNIKTLFVNTNVSGALTVSATTTLALSTFTLGATTAPTSLAMECAPTSGSGSSITGNAGTGTLTLGGNVTVTKVGSGTSGATISAPVSLGAGDRTFTVDDDLSTALDLSVSGIISGAHNLLKSGSGSMELSALNSYSGTTTVSAGILRATNNTVVASTTGPFGNNASGLNLNGGTIQSNIVTFSRPITVTATNSGLDAFGSARTISSTIAHDGTASAFNLNVGGTTVTNAEGQDLTLSGIISNATGTISLSKNGTSKVIMNATNTYTGGSTLNLGTLQLSNTAGLGAAGQAVALNGGTLDLATATTVNAYNITVGGNAIINSNLASPGAGITHVLGTLSIGAQTLTINKGGNVSSGTAAVQFGNLTLTGIATLSPGTANLLMTGTESGNFKLTKSGAGTLQKTTNDWSLPNDFEVNAGTYDANTRATTVTGLTTLSGTGTYLASTALQTFTGGLTISGGTFTGAGGNVTTTDVNLSSGTLTAPSGTFNVSGNWAQSGGLFTPGSNAVTFTKASSIQTLNSGSTSFNNILHNGAGTLQLSTSALITGGTFINSSGTFDANGIAHTVTGLATISGGEYQAKAGTQTFNGGLTISGGTFTGAGGNVTTTDVTLSSGTLTAPSGSFNVSGNWARSGGIFTPGSNTITFTKASTTQTLNSGGSSFNNIIHSGAGTLQLLTSALGTGGTFTNSAGTFDANGIAHTVTGLATISGGEYQAKAGTQIFNGGLSVSGGTFTGAAGTVNATNVSITSGTLTAPGSSGAFNVTGDWTVNTGVTFTPNGGTVSFNSTSADQNINGTAVTQTFNSVTITKSLTKLIIGGSTTKVTVGGTLTMITGNIDCGSSNILEIGTSIGSIGALSYSAGNIIGIVKQWFNATGANILPLGTTGASGTASSNRKVLVTFNNITPGSLTANFVASDPGSTGLPLSENSFGITNQFTEGYWSLLAGNSLASNNYDLELTGTGFVSHTEDANVRIIKRPNAGGSWILDGTHVPDVSSIAKRAGLNGFGEYAHAEADACLSGVSAPSPSTQTVCNNTTIGGITVTPTGGIVLTYQWYSNTIDNNTTGSSLGSGSHGEQTATYTPPATVTAGTTFYYCIVSQSGCTSINSTTANVTVNAAVNYGTVTSADESVCSPGDPSNITFSAPPSGGAGTFSYQWYYHDGIVSCPMGSDVLDWTQIGSATGSSYDPPSGLTISRTYAVQADATGTPDCGVATWASGCRKVTVNARQTISGTFYYYNIGGDIALTSQDITVKLYRHSDNFLMGTINTDGSGNYQFTDLCPATDYDIVATSTHTTAGSVNTTDAAQDNFWGVTPSSIEKVRLYAGDVTGIDFFINSGDAHLIQAHFVNGTPFDKGTWNFWRVGETISNQTSPPTVSFPTVTLLVGSNLTADMYGLCAGDFNRSFDPRLTKSASSTLDLIYGAERQVSNNKEFDLPLHIVNASEVGAISLILNFPTDLVEVKDVVMNGAGGQLDWAVRGNELRIGWHSMNPLRFEANDELLTLKLKSTDAFTKGNSVRFSLAQDPLNELADDQYNVIGDAVLSVDVIDASPVGIEEQTPVNGLTLTNHPNPFNSYTIFDYTLPFDGKVTLEIRNLLGVTEKILVNEMQASGDHTLKFDAASLPSGIYTATIRLRNDSDMLVRTIKLVSSR